MVRSDRGNCPFQGCFEGTDRADNEELRVIRWRKSSHSGGGNDDACVELANLEGNVGVRDSKDPEGPRLGFSRDDFGGLLARIRRGELDD
ncbi:DUF397 domain-containing protein [Actinomadura sp. CNU-125]|uniref:DUF397 domain-containing protein n=1 Tax=Actinomadura sp. CNU-125 TaxID=1904961 RepID=UPI0009FB324D|nr:DUF397 domain-containing protein [Actinomadura sp. CNU-125]